MQNDATTDNRDLGAAEMSRRQALARLGLAVSAAYAAPTLVALKRAAAGSGGGGADSSASP